MCKLKGQGKRCPTTPQRKEAESFRQKVKYYAHREGVTSKEWLSSEKGTKFAQDNDPRILNPNWANEHAENLKKMHDEPRVTMSDNFLTKSEKFDIIKATFPTKDEIRGTHVERDKHYHTYEDDYALEIVKFNHKQDDELSSEEKKAIDTYTSSGKHEILNRYLREVTHDKDMSLSTYANRVHQWTGNFDKGFTDFDHFTSIYERKEKENLAVINNLDNVLAGRRKLDKPEITYRAIKSDQPMEELMEKYQPNTTITFDNYSSTSHALTPSLEFSNLKKIRIDPETKTKTLENYGDNEDNQNSVIFELQTNAGMSVVNHTEFVHEKEILLPRGINFKVVNSYKPDNTNPYKLTRYDTNDKCQVQSNTVIVQLVECDKDGNILSFDETEPIVPKPLEALMPKLLAEK